MTILSSTAVTASSTLIVITAHGSAHTKGSWTELISAAGHTATTYWIRLDMEGSNTGGIRSFLIDIGTGGAGAESAVVSNIAFNDKGTASASITFPITISSGTRISARCQASTGSATCTVCINAMTDSQWGTSTSNESTALTATSKGAVVTADGTAHTKTVTPIELIASTGIIYNYWIVQIGLNNNDTIGTGSDNLVDIMTGAGGAEVVLAPDIFLYHNAAESNFVNAVFFHQIAAGTRLSARAQSSDTDATDRVSSVSVLGFAMTAPSGGGGGMRLAGHGGLAA